MTGRGDAARLVEEALDDRHEALGCLELGCMTHPVEYAEVDGPVADGRGAGEGNAHERVLGTVDEQCRAGCGRDGEVGIEVAGDLLDERPGRVGVGRGRLGVGEALGGEEHEASAQVGVEALGVVQRDPETQIDESFRAEHPGACRDRSASERRHHHRHVARDPHPRRRWDTTPRQRRVHEHERIDEVGAACGNAGTDHATHRVPEDRRGTDLLQQTQHEVAVRRDRRAPLRRACSSEPDEVDRGHGRVEAIREELADRLPRQRVGAEAVDEEDLAPTCGGCGCGGCGCIGYGGVRDARSIGGGGPADRVHADAVDLEVLHSARVHPSRLGDGRLGIDPIPPACTIEWVVARNVVGVASGGVGWCPVGV